MKTKQVDIPQRIKKKKEEFTTMIMSVGRCTQRKARIGGHLCWVVCFQACGHRSCLKRWTVAPRPHAATVPKREVIVKSHGLQNQSCLPAIAEPFLVFSGDWDRNLLEFHRDPFWYFPGFIFSFLYVACFCCMESLYINLNNQTQTLLFPGGVRCARWQMAAFSWNFLFSLKTKFGKLSSGSQFQQKKNPFSLAGIWEKKVTPLSATSNCLPVIFFFAVASFIVISLLLLLFRERNFEKGPWMFTMSSTLKLLR